MVMVQLLLHNSRQQATYFPVNSTWNAFGTYTFRCTHKPKNIPDKIPKFRIVQ